MQEDISFYKVIDKKVIDWSEIVLCLFEHCNLLCAFCPQDHSSILGASEEEILNKVSTITRYIERNNRSKHFIINTMGGELLQDTWTDKGFLNIYSKFIKQVREKVSSDKTIVFNFVTNLVFDRTDLILDFVKKNNIVLSVSYDIIGRFNATTLEIFKKNIDIFKPYIKTISCVLTKQNIEKIIEGDEYFDYLYENFKTIYFDSLLPSVTRKTNIFMMPAESETFKFYKLCVDKYPKILNIEPFLNGKTNNKMTCTKGNSLTIMPDGSIPKGCSGAVLLKDATQNTEDLGGTKIIENFMKKYNCFECEFFQRCPFTCFIKQDFKFIEHDMKECVFKETFRYADSKK
jgi:hypothetical protein